MSLQSMHNMSMIPLQDAKQIEAAVVPLKFWIKYREQKDGTLKAEEWVEVAKKGVSIPTTVPYRIDRIQKAAAKATEPDDEPAALWRTLKPFYDNWKAGGTEEVINGTPLAIWPGVMRDVVEALRPFKIYSVEDLSIATDAVLQRVPDPNIMMYRDRAKKFLNTKDIAQAVRDLTEKDAELADLRAMVEKLQKAHADSELKRGDAERELDDATPALARKKRVKAEAA